MMHLVRWLLCAALILPCVAPAAERITDFHSDVFVGADSRMRVVESITVEAEGKAIRRGIFRDFPTVYRDHRKNVYRVGFEVVEVTRNGRPEPYFVKRIDDGVRVYIGREERLIEPGTHTYRLTYVTDRQLGFFEDHDELYWNVTGHEWAFPIDRASARVELPDAIESEQMRLLGFTGPYGSRDAALTAEVEAASLAYFATTGPLAAGEGLTIVVMWPKGHVVPPTRSERLGYLLRDNRHLLAGSLGFGTLVGYYLLAWFRVGKDPEPGVIYARYRPPPDYSPAALRYIRRMGYDAKCFAAAIVNLAVQGRLAIEQAGPRYTLDMQDADSPLKPGEKSLMTALFGGGSRIVLENSNHSRISRAMDAHEQALEDDYERIYFLHNIAYFAGGVLITLVMAVAVILLALESGIGGEQAGIMLWLTFWLFGTVPITVRAARAWGRVHSLPSFARAVSLSLFALPFAGAAAWVFFSQIGGVPLLLKVLVVATIAVNFVFYHWLKKPTLLGRELLDEVEGFREYVDIAEKQELDYRYPGGRTPELFEKYLPYAVALDIEQQWGEQFSGVLREAAAGDQGYSPSWYRGSRWNVDRVGDFTSSLGSSFGDAVSRSASAPGTSSGGGGGGFSGGGGGGGGGGGW